MSASRILLVLCAISLSSCGDSKEVTQEQAAVADSIKSPPSVSGAKTGYSRDNFLLCPALDKNREELGRVVGIAQSPEANEGGNQGTKCVFKGVERGSWLKVELMPAFLKPSQLRPEAFDAPATSIPELGEHGWYISDDYLRRVIFTMGPLILSVEAESDPRPDRTEMLAVSRRVMDILVEANQ